jgi:hypothetical protein
MPSPGVHATSGLGPSTIGDVGLGALHHQHVFDAGHGITGESLIYGGFEGNHLVFAEAAIGGNHQLGFGILQPVFQGLGTEPPKHDGMGSANAGAGQHGNGRFGNHWHINADAISFFNPQLLHHIGNLAHLVVQLGIGQSAGIAQVHLPKLGRLCCDAR